MPALGSDPDDAPPVDSNCESGATSMFSALPQEHYAAQGKSTGNSGPQEPHRPEEQKELKKQDFSKDAPLTSSGISDTGRAANAAEGLPAESAAYEATKIFKHSSYPTKGAQQVRWRNAAESREAAVGLRRVEDRCAELNEVLGRKYEVIRWIGTGGMAEVFLARNVAHGAFFAVKVLAEHLAHIPRVVARFEEEARLEACLSGHPNIVPVFDIGAGNGLHYIVMPYVQGEDLASFLSRGGRIRPYDAANIVAQVAEALSWAEAKGVVHRDLKPANIRLDTSGRAIVLDFGIAKASFGSGDMTLPGEGLGTPFYMSPEQFLGEECDARSDLYSLGIVFFELLTGERPFNGDGFASIRKAHLAADRPLVRSFGPELPVSYENLVLKLLQKDPQDRFQTAKDLLAALSRLGVKSDRSTLLPHLDEDSIPEATPPSSDANAYPHGPAERSQEYDVSPAYKRRANDEDRELHQGRGLADRAKHRSHVIIASGLVALALVLGTIAVLVLSRPKASITDAAGSMVLVPAGSFIFGDDSPISPSPRRKISLKGFYVDQTEVSNAQYKRFCDATGYTPPVSATYLSQPLHPVADVTFADAQAYAAWAGKRLPTEEEWEKSARGTDGRPLPWGWDPWTEGVPHELQTVDSFKARQSPFGALNMSGNVWEWTQSPFPAKEADYAGFKSSVGIDLSRRWYSIKGGSFSPKNDPRHLLTYTRGGWPKDGHSPYIGFRCVRDVPASPLSDKLRRLFAR
jgi:serine/threonine protein kinase